MHYIVIFKNLRDGTQITHLAKQMFPLNTRLMTHAYKQATKEPHSYLFMDLKQTTPDIPRLHTGILPDSDLCKTYIC